VNSAIPQQVQDSALRLLNLEGAEGAVATGRVCEKLRDHLTGMVGATGFTTLLRRSLVMSRKEHPVLEGIQVGEDGRLTGFTELRDTLTGEPLLLGGTALVAQLLFLLQTFIGETLTQQLLQEIWPSAKPTSPAPKNPKP